MCNEFKPEPEYCVNGEFVSTENWNHEFITRLIREALAARLNKTGAAVHRAEKTLGRAQQAHYECVYRINNPA